jgi:acyl-CoA synthetase (AMP-forming)/AMP-acid ligase II
MLDQGIFSSGALSQLIPRTGAARKLPDHIATIPDALAFWASATPNAPALRATDGRELSHLELHALGAGVAARLTERGVARQDRVALVLPTGLDACVALLGIMSSAVAVPLNPALAATELARDLTRLRPGLIVTGGQHEDMARDIAAGLVIPVVTVADVLATTDADPFIAVSRTATSPEHVAVIQHTSGTTALPKRAPRTHGSYCVSIRVARESLRLTPDDVLLLTASTHNNLGLADLLAALLNGGTCVVTGGFDPQTYPSLLRKHRPTWAVLTPYELALLLDQAGAAGQGDFAGSESRLRAVLAEAQAIPAAMRERAECQLQAPVLTGYGMTETGNIARFGLDDLNRREGSCGRSRCLAIRIVDAAGHEVAPGAAGEIVVSGPTLFSGYLDDADATAAAFLPDGWFRTGDCGYLDQDGFLFLTGRIAETINRGGENIAPAEVDAVLARHPAVAEAAVFPIPDERLGEDLVAAVVLRSGVTASPRAVRQWLLGRLSPHKVPRRIWIVDTLPRTSTGKVVRQALSDRYLARPR